MSESDAPRPSEKFDLVSRAKEEAEELLRSINETRVSATPISETMRRAILEAAEHDRNAMKAYVEMVNVNQSVSEQLRAISGDLIAGSSLARLAVGPALSNDLKTAQLEFERMERERKEMMLPPQIFFPPRIPRDREIIREKEIIRETKTFVYIISSPFVAEEVRVETTKQNLFVRKGEAWLLGIDGDVRPASHQQGFEYIAYAIARPGQSLIHINVFDDLSKQDVFESTDGSDPKADDETIRAVKERYRILKDDMEEAEKDGLTVLAEKYREQMRPLGEYLSSRLAPGGRLRLDPDRDRKTRESINRAIRRALNDLETLHPALHYHLKRHLSLTPLLSYHPDTLPDWEL